MTPCGEAYQMNEGRVNRSGSGEEETYGGKMADSRESKSAS